MSDVDEFYVGYAGSMPPRTRRFLLALVLPLVFGTPILAGSLITLHAPYADARAEGARTIEGILLAEPAPHLMVPRPADGGFSRYFLVGGGKYGVWPSILKHAGGWTRITGSLIYRDGTTLVAVYKAEAIEAPANAAGPVDLSDGEPLGTFSLRGEIVDSKCYFGTMRPGDTKVHRGCAVRCIAGGVPPVLLVRDQDGNAMSFLLVATDGQPVNDDVLDFVAEPIEVTGSVVRRGDAFVLYADPTTYRRL